MKKNTGKIVRFFIVCLFVVSLFSCATKGPEVPTLTKFENQMLWKIEGSDHKGRLSTIYVLGTIHVGDERLYPLTTEVEDAFGYADKFYGEISSAGWDSLLLKTSMRMNRAAIEAEMIKEELGYGWYDQLTEEQRALLVDKIGEATLSTIKDSMPWVTNNVLTSALSAETGYNSNYAYDMHFTEICKNLNIKLEGLDEVDTQLDVLSYGDYDFQLNMLIESINEVLENSNVVKEEFVKLYEAYLTGDENKIAAITYDEIKNEVAENPELEGYYNALYLDRNTNWAETFSQLLYEGGSTFVFAGCGHFVGADSVFEIMKSKGDLVF
jgi:uncharacterized protein YbaP (TraB family)